METLKIDDFNKLQIGQRVKVYAPDVCDKVMTGRIEGNEYVVDKYVELDNGEEIFFFDIKGIWGIDKNGNREEL